MCRNKDFQEIIRVGKKVKKQVCRRILIFCNSIALSNLKQNIIFILPYLKRFLSYEVMSREVRSFGFECQIRHNTLPGQNILHLDILNYSSVMLVT